MTSVRIVNVDYYMSYPLRELDTNYSEFRGVEVRQVPVIQIFGTSETGHKTCVHIHGVFPYVYIPYDGKEFAGNLSYKIAAELDKALNISLGQASANTCHVHNIVLVSGIPFYGYHERQHQFFKIFFYNPAIIKKACSLLENGAILGKCFQPHESHINYILQFMIDYNLHGMSFVNISSIMYRANPDDPNLLDNIPLNLILSNDIRRRTVCKFEIDAQASCITNKNEISTGKMAVNPGIAALWADEKQRRRDKQMDSQISFCLTQERNEVNPTATHIYFENKLVEKLIRESQSDESSLDLSRSVYPAETPENSGLMDASTADYTVVDFANTTSLDETIQESQSIHYNENDVNLLKILQDLKETAHVDEDSILSQKVKQEKSESSDEDDHNMSLPLRKTVADDESVWEDSYWDENCEIPSQIPQLDGIYDSEDSCQSDSFNMDEIDDALSKFEPSNWKKIRGEALDKFRYANEVYLHKSSFDIPAEKLLKPGMNKLILTERKSSIIPPTCKIKVLRDVYINSGDDIIKDLFKMEKEPPECNHIDNNYNKDAYPNDFVPNEVIINDVSFGNSTPASLPTWESKSLINSISNSGRQSTNSFDNYYDEDDTFFGEIKSFNYSFIKEKTPVNSKIDNNKNNKKDIELTRKQNVTNHVKRALNYDNFEDETNNKNKDVIVTKNQTKNESNNATAEQTVMNPRSQYNLRKCLNKSYEEKKCITCPVCIESVSLNPKKISQNRKKNIPTLFTEDKSKTCPVCSKSEFLNPNILFPEDCYYYSSTCVNSESQNLELSNQCTTNCTLLSPERDKILKTETSNNTCTNKDEEECKYAQVNNLNVNNSGIKNCTSENNYLENVATKNVLETNSSKENIQLLEAKKLNWNLDGQFDTTSDSTLSPDEEASKIINDPKKNNKNGSDKKKKMLCIASGLTKPVQKTIKTTISKNHSRKIGDCEIERAIEEKKSYVIDNNNKDTDYDRDSLKNIQKRLMELKPEISFTQSKELEFSKEKSTEKDSIATEINKNELKMIRIPLDLNTLKTSTNKSNKNTAILEGNNSCTDSDDSELSKNNSVKFNTLNIKANICHPNSSTDSSDIEQLDKEMITEFVINEKTETRETGCPRKTIRSETEKCDENKTEILKNKRVEKKGRGRPKKRTELNNNAGILEGNNPMKFNTLNIESNICNPNSSTDSSDIEQLDKEMITEIVLNKKTETRKIGCPKETIQSETEECDEKKTETLKNKRVEKRGRGRPRKSTKLDENTDKAMKFNTLNIESNICNPNSSIDSSDIEQLDKEIITEFVINNKTETRKIGCPRETIKSETEECDEKNTEILKNKRVEKRGRGRQRKSTKLDKNADILEGNNAMKFNTLNIKSNICNANSSTDSSDIEQLDKEMITEFVINKKTETRKIGCPRETIQSETEECDEKKMEILKNIRVEKRGRGRPRKSTKLDKNTDILEGNNAMKFNTLNIKLNICHTNSSTDSSDIEQLDKEMITEFVINKKTEIRKMGCPRETIQSETEECDEKKKEIFKNIRVEKRGRGRPRKSTKLDKNADILEGNNAMKFNTLNIKSNICHPNSSSDSSDTVQPDKKTKTEIVINKETETCNGTKTEILKNQTKYNRDGRLRKRTKSITEIGKISHVNQIDNTTKMIKNSNPAKMKLCSSSSEEIMQTKNILRNRKVKILKKKLSTKKPTINTVKLRNSKLIKTNQTSNEKCKVFNEIKPRVSKDNSEIPKTKNNIRGEKEIRRTVLRNLRNNSSSDSLTSSQEKLSNNNDSKKSVTFKIQNREVLEHQTTNENSEDPVKSNDISSYKEIPKKVETNTTLVIKSPLQVKKEIQEILFKNAIVRLDRLRCIESQYSIKNKVNKSEEKLENLNIPSYAQNDEPHSLKNFTINGGRPKRKSTIKKVNSAQLNKSPVRGTKSKNNVSPKYSPLNVIVRSPKKHSNLIQTDSNYEPISKRLRSDSYKTHTENVGNPINTNDNQSEKENLQNFQGTGELQNIPVNQEGAKIQAANVKTNISEPKSCDIDKNRLKCSTPDSIKKQLFSIENKNLSTTCKELKICSYEKLSPKVSSSNCTDSVERDIYYLRRLRQEEENFLKDIDTHYGTKNSHEQHVEQVNKFDNNICFTELISKDVLNNTTEQIISIPVISESKNIKLNNEINTNENNTTIRRIVKKKDKKPVPPIIPEDFVDLDVTPKKDTSDESISFYTPHTTLEDQDEYELCNIEKYNTKMNDLTVSEKYDLERDFAPQPSTSKTCEEITTYHVSSNTSFTCNDISLIDNSYILNYSRYSQNESVSLLEVNITNENNSRIWMPKYYPPSKEDIKRSLSDYNIPEHRFQQPFYSDYSDVTGKIDIGHNVLKIPSTTIVDLEEFESSNDFCGIEKWRKEKFTSLYSEVKLNKNFRTALADHSKIIITPVNPPPTREDISSWLKTKINEAEGNLIKKIEKPRIIIPLSPGNSNDSFNESMTLSPCTPDVISLPSSQNVIESSQETPVSSQNIPSVSKNGKFKKKGNLQRKALFSQPKQNSQEDQKQLKLINVTEHYSSNDSCQITGVTMDNTHGFKMSFENLQNAKAVSEHQYLTVLVVELHIRTRGEMYPDPQYDSVRALFYSILNDVPVDFSLPREETGIIVVDSLPGSPVKQKTPILEGAGVNCKINYVKSEIELIDEFIKLIRKWDPDIFVGFEIEMLSWGYLIERCSVIGINLLMQISRTNPAIIKNKSNDNKQTEQELKLTGRIILDAWRLFRHEIALQSYTFENLMYHILHQRVPAHTFKDLSFWWEHRSNYFRYITANYYITRVEGVLKLLDQLDLIGRTSELARLFGIQFFEVLSRGSQFRVESMMLRLAKPLNFIPISPSVQQRAKMRAPEWVPLILEPESRFYTDPLIVLDFQSLYPSIIIAYNYCFSTCIGRVENLGSNDPFDFGACQLKIKRSNVKKLQNKLNFSPCGVGFVKPEVRQGILPRMLKEILETRLMVKSSMKENKGNKLLQRVLHSRQLGLKLIANVTYGYTSANFSGRMPCIEVGDSVVSKGRETLERAIKMIEQTERWRARVVYGDTDSLFVLVPGRSREDAFKIGAEIAEAVTNDNPPPVKLKLEKVYHPSLLQTKKRYVGYMYESPDQKEPEYDAKGIETVRRDGCPAVAKMLEKSLRLLFETRDMSLVKRYVCRQFEKLLTGRASIQDLVFAREYRGSGGYRPGACVPALELARRWAAVDKRREPRRNERVPYIVVHGPPGVPLIRLVRCPRELLYQEQHTSLRPNAVYYITKVIAPPLNRCLSLIGADVQVWYNEMPRKQLQILPTDVHFEQSKKSTISQYFATMSCVVCNNQTRDGLCEDCCSNSQHTIVVLQEKVCHWERSFENIKQICQSCCGRVQYTDCISLDCPVLYRLNQIKRDLKQVPFVRNLICKF